MEDLIKIQRKNLKKEILIHFIHILGVMFFTVGSIHFKEYLIAFIQISLMFGLGYQILLMLCALKDLSK
jgi:hypothetical protein